MVNNPCHLTPEQYFDSKFDLQGKDIGRPMEQSSKVQKFKAQLWLAQEYPLSLQEQVLPIIDLMAASNAHFKKLKDFITLQLPAGFPVKIGNHAKRIKGLKLTSPCMWLRTNIIVAYNDNYNHCHYSMIFTQP